MYNQQLKIAIIYHFHNYIYISHWSGSNVELEKITQANNLYGCLGIGLRYSEILEFKSKDGGFPNYDHIRFLFYEKIRPKTLK